GRAARRALNRFGVSNTQIDHLWNSGQLRDVPSQLVISALGERELERENKAKRMREIANKRVPAQQPHSPGYAAPSPRFQEEEDLRGLQRQLGPIPTGLAALQGNGLTLRQQLDRSVPYTQARRRAGLL